MADNDVTGSGSVVVAMMWTDRPAAVCVCVSLLHLRRRLRDVTTWERPVMS